MSERDELIEIVRRLETLAEDVGDDDEHPQKDEVGALLAAFNERTRSECTARTFRRLYQSQEPEDFVDGTLALRDAPPLPDTLTEAELVALVERAAGESGGIADVERAGEALARASRLPEPLARDLGSGTGIVACWPSAADIVEFALRYQPASSVADVHALARAWLAERASSECTVMRACGIDLVLIEHDRFPSPELEPFARAARSGVHARIEIAARNLAARFAPARR